ncbi:cellulase family glycosylhydrolase [Arsenicicoccus dermatophilus]|uniref:cellulase family glycosylhydrolase n=1 Tax=Arsenicicoccus dermatophilus TaxID=1076331 RepID=UPI001F4C7D20|nr:cellulase family glycosylhydrolase [Arsenicicoccus dermatophilus]MCH8612784.1 cellulase family glycosylhydrolase [Arsenicicoccus dermatophilus]
MTRPATLLALGLALAAPALPALAAPAQAHTPQTPTGTARPTVTTRAGEVERWQSHGRWIVDGQGRVVITHGVNEVEKNAPYAPDAVGFGEEDAAFLQQQGFTSVRLGVIWSGVEPSPGKYDDAYLQRIERTVALLHAHGISSLLDFHQDMVNPKFQGNGWPDWAVLDKGAPNIVKAGFPGNYFLNEGVKNSYDSFYDDAPASDGVGIATHYAKAWGHTAAHFKDVPGVMGYDLYNEPFPGHGYLECLGANGCPKADGRLSVVQQKAVDAIRAVDPRTTVYYEPMQFFNIAKPTHVRLKGTNLALSFHDYCVNQATMHRYAGCAGPDAKVFANAEDHARTTGSGLLMTEFGAITAQDVLRAQTDLAAKNLVGWQYWAYTGGDPTTAGPGNEQALVFDPRKDPTGDNVDWKKLDAIAVVHPDRVAGRPSAYGYDRDKGVFTMAWSALRPDESLAGPDDETTVVVPERIRAAGYTVEATGAKVTSKPGDAVVRLHLEPGAKDARVTITRTKTTR